MSNISVYVYSNFSRLALVGAHLLETRKETLGSTVFVLSNCGSTSKIEFYKVDLLLLARYGYKLQISSEIKIPTYRDKYHWRFLSARDRCLKY